MPAHHHPKSRSFGFQIQLVQIVKNVDRDSAYFEHIRGENFASPSIAIHVAANRCDRSDLGQLIQNGRITDVPSMNDVVGSAKNGESLRAKQAVGIRDNADDHRL